MLGAMKAVGFFVFEFGLGAGSAALLGAPLGWSVAAGLLVALLHVLYRRLGIEKPNA
jgi:hypothetical protein